MEIRTGKEVVGKYDENWKPKDSVKKQCNNEKWVAVEDVIKLLNKTLIMIPHYQEGENHLQYLNRYKQYLIKKVI